MTCGKGELFTLMKKMSTYKLEMFLEKQLNFRSDNVLTNLN